MVRPELSGPYHTHLNLHCNVHPHAHTASSIATGWLESRETHQSPHQLPIVGAALVLALGLDPTSNHACICAVPSPAVERKSTRTPVRVRLRSTSPLYVPMLIWFRSEHQPSDDIPIDAGQLQGTIGSSVVYLASDARTRAGRWRQSCNAARKARGILLVISHHPCRVPHLPS